MLERIESYKQKNGDGVLKAILNNNKGCFYVSEEDAYLLNTDSWNKTSIKNGKYIVRTEHKKTVYFHREVLNADDEDTVLFKNRVNFDCTRNNMILIKDTSSCYKNKPTQGYKRVRGRFVPQTTVFGELVTKKAVHDEITACIEQSNFEDTTYNFLSDFKDDLDLLDAYRTGQIDWLEMEYEKLKRYYNAWYYFRYNLASEYSKFKMCIPPYRLDDKGFLINPETGEYLNPFKKLNETGT